MRPGRGPVAHYNPPMPTLILALPLTKPTAATEFDYVVSSEARPQADHGTAPLALLPPADAIVLVAPARALSWHRVRVPPVAAGRMRAALAGLLEDHLLDDPTQLAFALVPGRTEDGQSLVVAFDKSWLQAALQLFEQAQRPVRRVVPAFFPDAVVNPTVQLHVTGSADDAGLVIVDARGVTCLPLASATAAFVDRALPQAGDPVTAEPAVAGLAEQVLGRAVTVQPASQVLLQASRCEWDLAQFELSTRGGGRLARRWQQQAHQWLFAPAWRPARWGLLALVLAHLVGMNAWAWKLDAVVRDKQQRVNALLTQAFPGVRTIVDAPRQMQRELAGLRQSSGGITAHDLEAMPAGIDFVPGEIAVRGLELAGPQRESLQADLRNQGYELQTDGGRLLLRRLGSP